MAEEIVKIVKVDVQGTQTVKGLKQEISDLRDALLNTEQGTQQYDDIVNQLIEDEKSLTEVMRVGKNEVSAATGSYNALQNEMTALKKVWKEVNDEASRNEIGAKINAINDQLKGMDASIGDFHRSVGDYNNAIAKGSQEILKNLGQINPALASVGQQTSKLIPLITNVTKTATTGLKGIKAALVSTGIGALIVGLGLLISNWDKISEAVSKYLPFGRKARDIAEEQTKANKKLLETNKTNTAQMDYQARIMQAQGVAQSQIIAYKIKETEALKENTDAQIKETEAKINSMKAHSAWYRFWHGENKQIKALEESLKTLKEESTKLGESATKLQEDYTVAVIEENKKRSDEQKKATEDLKKQFKDRFEAYKQYLKQVQTLKESFYDEEKKLDVAYADNTNTIFKGFFASILKEAQTDLFEKNLDNIKEQMKEFPKEVQDSIYDAIKNLDFTQSAEELTTQFKAGLLQIDTKDWDKSLKGKFNTLFNSIKFEELSYDTKVKIEKAFNKAFKNVEFKDAIEDIKVALNDVFALDINKDKVTEELNRITEELKKFPPEVQDVMKAVIDAVDTNSLPEEIEKQIKEGLDKINIAAGESFTEELQALYDSISFPDTLFGDNYQAILDEFQALWDKVKAEDEKNRKELHTKQVLQETENAQALIDLQAENYAKQRELELKEYETRMEYDDGEWNARYRVKIAQYEKEKEIVNAVFEERKKALENYIQLYQKIADDEQATDEARADAKAKVAQAQIDLSNLIKENEITNLEIMNDIAKEQFEIEKEMVNNISDMVQSIGDILGTVADYWSDYIQAQMDAGKMSEEEGKKQFEWVKALQIAEATVNTIAGAVAAFMGITSETGGWGIAAAIAEAAAVTAAGVAQIAKIANTTIGGGSSVGGSVAYASPTAQYNPTYTSNTTGLEETENLANAISQQPIFVNVVEVENMMGKRQVRATESTF